MPTTDGYIGISTNVEQRRKQHFSTLLAGTHTNGHLQNAFDKYKDLYLEILHTCKTEQEMIDWEAHYRPEPRIGWNIKAGGSTGVLMDEESKRRISEKHKGKTVKASTREKLRQANLGKKQTQETIDKRSNTLSKLYKGKKKTSEAEIRSLVEGRKGAGNPMAKLANIYNYTTKELIAANVNITAWCRDNPDYKAKQLQRTANHNEPNIEHNGIFAIYILKETPNEH